MSHSKYRMWCETEEAHVYEWAEATPTKCPNNTGHTIDAGRTTILQTCDCQTVTLDGPKQSDGSPYVAPCIFPDGVYLYVTGAGDGTNRGDGTEFNLSSEEVGDSVKEWSFKDWVLVAGGGVLFSGAAVGDWISLKTYCPDTTVTPNVTNTGNCDLVDPGVGQNILIVPADGDGAYDVDLEDANPVPSTTATGYYDWNYPDTGKGVVSVGEAGAASYNLFTIDVDLVRFVNRMPLLGSGEIDVTIPAVEPKIILPHWVGKVTLHNGGHTGLKTSWYLSFARKQTV